MVDLLSSKAKYCVLANASKEATWLTMILKDLHLKIKWPTIIYYDNAASISIAANLEVNPKTRHIIVHYHFTREKIK